LLVVCVYFFFQAEDGIRDKLVTGVQTCALPIFDNTVVLHLNRERIVLQIAVFVAEIIADHAVDDESPVGVARCGENFAARKISRSEERRVGKEGRAWW